MAHSAEEYASLLKNLLPPGQAFRREPGTNLDTFLGALAIELARVDARAEQLPVEVNPLTTTELLYEWEQVAGLPDKCSGQLEDTLQGRRNALAAKLSSVGGQSIAYFVSVAAQLGYEISVTEFRPFRAGLSQAGQPISNGDWIFSWQVNAPQTTIIEFKAGRSAAGEPLRSWGNSALECKINQIKPAHTLAIFAYGIPEIQAAVKAADTWYFAMNYQIPEEMQ